ncbi:SpoIID/LytB domain-containing protein [Ferroacidibacillus organovorans]|uniref:Sporulation stage II protein D amidase enhancer LytB N-terminal domain-containing protein n=1 Tax=Ferroacidibacillus organovorans TaxID=1765683 RepID=A0A101XNI8_9BACL|nr:SpoIID/LytB domain-containing protein [Ferroacidibacillus organovorans]KUO94645.1 hypothetical protein ATW55_01895 [Ferroacidibacillus organovorans]
MKRTTNILLAGFIAAGSLSLISTKNVSAQLQTIYNTSYPSTIRVAIRAYNNPVSPILYVQTVGFEEYCKDVLPNEWYPSWNQEALKAGAVAVKMFGWYHTLHPVTQSGFTYDVDNTTNYQQFKYLSGQTVTDQAVQDTWNEVYTLPTGEIKELSYRAGLPNRENRGFLSTNIMSQWGSEYFGHVARMLYPNILNLYYPNYLLKFI